VLDQYIAKLVGIGRLTVPNRTFAPPQWRGREGWRIDPLYALTICSLALFAVLVATRCIRRDYDHRVRELLQCDLGGGRLGIHVRSRAPNLKRLKREIDSGKSSAASSVSPQPQTIGPVPPASSSSTSVAGPQTQPATRKHWLASAIVILVALIAAGMWYWRSSFNAAQIESVAVIPFSYSGGNADTDLLSDGITQSLIDSLAHLPELKVKSRNSVFRYKGKEIDIQKLGKELEVDALLTGRVVEHADSIQVSADLTNVRDNTEIWGEQYDRKASDVLALQQQIASDIAEKLRSKLTGAEKQQVSKQGTQNPEAFQLYVKGRYYWNKRTNADLKTAISFFNQALEKDPGYALAYSGLADAYSVLISYGADPNEVIPKANAAAQKALELDPTLAHPRSVLASSKFEYAFDFAGGEADYRKAIALDPSDASAHHWFSLDLASIGRIQEAIDEVERAHQLDPLSPIISVVRANPYLAGRQFDKVIEMTNKVLAEYPDLGRAHAGFLAPAYWSQHRYSDAIKEWNIGARLEGDKNRAEVAESMDTGFRSGGKSGALRGAIQVLLAQRKAGKSFVPPDWIATIYADLGDKDHAFQWLEIAYKEHDSAIITQKPVPVVSSPPDDSPSLGDPDALVYTPLKPKPTPRSGAAALPEPHDAEDAFAAMAPPRISK
jgi:TolB-like protein